MNTLVELCKSFNLAYIKHVSQNQPDLIAYLSWMYARIIILQSSDDDSNLQLRWNRFFEPLRFTLAEAQLSIETWKAKQLASLEFARNLCGYLEMCAQLMTEVIHQPHCAINLVALETSSQLPHGDWQAARYYQQYIVLFTPVNTTLPIGVGCVNSPQLYSLQELFIPTASVHLQKILAYHRLGYDPQLQSYLAMGL